MKKLLIQLAAASLTMAETPKGLSDDDWSSIRATYEAERHAFHPQQDGSHLARNPGLGWRMTFDDKGFTATDGNWTWGLELETTTTANPAQVGRGVPTAPSSEAGRLRSPLPASKVSPPNGGGLGTTRPTLSIPRSGHVTEWFINDQRGLEQGWTLTAPAEIRLLVRGDLKPSVSPQSVSFGGQVTYAGLKAWDATGKIIPTHFEATAEGFAVRYDGTGAQYPIVIDPIAQNAYLKASNTGQEDNFGYSVAVSGDTVVVGAPYEDSNASGVNGHQTDNGANRSGAAYVFVRSASTWSQQAYLKASNTGAEDYFGWSVAVSGDTVVVGAINEDSNATGVNGNQADNSAAGSGAAYVFTRSGSTWSQHAYLKASNTGAEDYFGISVAVSADTVVVGAPDESSSATGVNGDQSDESAPLSGAAYVFVRSGSTWSQQAYLKASNTEGVDRFGCSVAVSGDTVVVGAPNESSNATGVNGNQSDESALFSGAAYVFARSGSNWSQQAYLKASNTGGGDDFGKSVAVSGDTVVVGAPSEDSNATAANGNQSDESAPLSGAAYVFVRSGSTWSQQAYLKASNTGPYDKFGLSVAVSGDIVVVGAWAENSNATGVNGNQGNNDASASGAAYVFVRSGSTWSQQAYLKASNTGAEDHFGISAAVSGDTVVLGAPSEDSNATAVNGNQADNGAYNSGAAYSFNLGEALFALTKTGYSASVPDLAYGTPGYGALSPGGETLLESGLLGTGAVAGKNKAMFSTIAGPVDLALQSGTIVSGLAGLPTGATIASVSAPVHNRTASVGIFQATVTGTGITASNNRLLLQDNGAFISAVRRTGIPVTELGGALPTAFREVLQRDGANDQIVLGYTLKTGTAGVNSSNESGLLLMDHAGTVNRADAREGNAAFGAPGSPVSGALGQFGRASTTSTDDFYFLAKFIPTGSTARDALFHIGGSTGRNIPEQGSSAGDTTAGEKYGVFTGITRIGNLGLLRATMTASPTTTNEGVWNSGGGLRLRKGQDIGGGVKVSKIVRVWGINGGQIVAQVVLNGTGVTTASNQALILRQVNGNILVLLRTGQVAPGIGLNKVTVGTIQTVDVDPVNGHYAVVGSLKGTTTSANQALWSGQTTLGDDTTNAFLRLPKLRLQKGERYSTAATPSDTIRSLALKPAADASGVGGRGLAQVINDDGDILLTITGDRSAKETVRLTP